MPSPPKPKPAPPKTFVKCDFCPKVFAAKYRLAIHIRTHTGEKPYTCDHCSFACNQKGNLVTHLKTHSGGQVLKCLGTSCAFSASNAHTLKVHENKCHGSKKSKEISTKKFEKFQKSASSEDLQAPAKIPNKNTYAIQSLPLKPYKGSVAPRGIEALTCVFCFKKFADRFKLQEHLRVHTGERPFNCSECSFACNKEINLRAHMRSHRGPALKCSMVNCYFSASNSKSLKKHHAIAHAQDKFPPEVSKKWISGATSEDLMKTEVSESFEGSSEASSRELQDVLAFETLGTFGGMKYKILACPAPDCEYETMYGASLRLHSRLHCSSMDEVELEGTLLKDGELEDLRKCEQCDFRYKLKKELAIHARKAHSADERVFRCPECEYVGGSFLSLRNHKRIHSMPYSCSFCAKAAMTRETIEKHENHCKSKV